MRNCSFRRSCGRRKGARSGKLSRRAWDRTSQSVVRKCTPPWCGNPRGGLAMGAAREQRSRKKSWSNRPARRASPTGPARPTSSHLSSVSRRRPNSRSLLCSRLALFDGKSPLPLPRIIHRLSLARAPARPPACLLATLHIKFYLS